MMFKLSSGACLRAFHTKFVAVRVFSLLACLLLASPIFFGGTRAAAQLAGTGAISGAVTDSTGAVIPGATVTATAMDTNSKTVRTTTGSGDFNITPLVPGTYSITVSANGFEGYVQQNITVDALVNVGLNVKLTVGQSSETVTVSSAPPLLSTTDAMLGAVMDQEMYSNLPIQMGAGGNNDQRRATDFEYLMPGVQGNFTSNNATSNSGIVNGSGPAGGVSEIYIDGVNLPEADQVGDPRFTWTAIGVDAIDQLQVQTAGYPAQYGGQGLQNYSIKHGGNQIHGSIYEYFRNTVLDAWAFTAKTPQLRAGIAPTPCVYGSPATAACAPGGLKPKEIQNEFGIVLSGPIVKDKLFLFLNYGQYRNQNGPKLSAVTIPTAAMIGYTAAGTPLGYADFTGYAASTGSHIYDPATQIPGCAGTVASPCARTQFMGMVNGIATADVIPGNRISIAAQNINKFYLPYEQQANQAAYTNNFSAGQSSGLANWYDTERLDYNQSSRHQISAIVAFGRQSSTGPNATGSGMLAPPFNTSQSFHPVTTVDIFKDTFTVNSHLVNQFEIGFGRYQSVSISPDDASIYAATNLGLTGNLAASGSATLPAGQAGGGFPGITYSSNNGTAPGSQAGYSWNSKVNNTYNITDNVQWVIGKHNLTIGAEVIDAQFNYYKALGPTGPMTYGFSSNQTENFSSGATLNTSSGSPIASYDLGAVNSSSVTNAAVPGLGTRWIDPSMWVQDDWKVSSKLTLNIGLRWDIWPSVREEHDIFSFLNPNGINPITGNKGTLQFAGNSIAGASCNCDSPSPTYFKNLAPRIGVAYAANEKTVIHGSFNVAYARGDWTSGSQSGSPSTVGFTPSATASAGISGAPAFYWDNTQCALGTNDSSPCGFTGTIAPPTPPAGGINLGSYLTTETSTLTNSGSGTVTYFDPYRGSRTPEFENWTFGIQRSITKDMSLTATYVGSQGHFISVTSGVFNRANRLPTYLSALAGYNTTGTTITPCTGPTCGFVTGTTTLLAGKATAANLQGALNLGFAPPNPYTTATYYAANSVASYYTNFPQYSGVSDSTSFVGNTAYHALQISLRQRAAHGFDFMLNYTFSKSIDDVGTFRLADNPRLDRSLSTTDQPQNLVGTGVYSSPYGTGKAKLHNFILNSLARDWNVSSIYTYHSGQPLVSTGSGCGGSSILIQCMPNIVPGQNGRQNQYGKNVTATASSPNYYGGIQYVNPAAFTVNIAGTQPNGGLATDYGKVQSSTTVQATSVGNGPALYVPGNAARVAPLGIFGMTYYDLDFGLKRNFPIYEKIQLQFEADLLNSTNHVIWTTPSGAANGSGLGLISGVANQPRDVQIAARFMW